MKDIRIKHLQGKRFDFLPCKTCDFNEYSDVDNLDSHAEIILEKLNLTNKEVIMVGDTLESDILGANKMGITSVLLNRRKENYKNNPIKPNYEINNLEQVLEVIF